MDKFLMICSTFFIVVIAVAVWAIHTIGGDLVASVSPEIVGFGIEGLLLVVLFGTYQSFRERQRKRKERVEIKRILLEQFALIIYWGDIEAESPFGIAPETYDFESLISRLTSGHKVEGLADVFVPSFAKHQASMFYALTPLVAQIDAGHVRVWTMMMNNIEGVANAEEQIANDQLAALYESIQKFCDLRVS